MHRLSPTLLEFQLGDTVARISHRTTTPFSDRVSIELASDKPVAYRILEAAGVPITEHVVVDGDVAPARRFFDTVGAPVVVKPARGVGGAGVVCQIDGVRELLRALRNARRFDRRAIVERQVPGDAYRLLLLDGRLLDALHRSAPRVTGDGVSTVGQLMLREYERRLSSGTPSAFFVDLDCLATLRRSGHTLGSVVPRGDSIAVKTASNHAGANENRSVREIVAPEIVQSAQIAASALGVRLAGVDVMTRDPRRGLEDAEGVILEVNPVPGLTHHYGVADPSSAVHVAVPVLAALLGVPPPHEDDGTSTAPRT